MHKHLAIMSKQVINQILNGKKTIESRFSQNKIAPFGLIHVGDIVYMKLTGSDIVGQFIVKKVVSFENLDNEDFEIIKKTYGKKLSLGTEKDDESYFLSHQNAKFATLVYIDKVEQLITSPITFKKKDQRGWVVLD